MTSIALYSVNWPFLSGNYQLTPRETRVKLIRDDFKRHNGNFHHKPRTILDLTNHLKENTKMDFDVNSFFLFFDLFRFHLVWIDPKVIRGENSNTPEKFYSCFVIFQLTLFAGNVHLTCSRRLCVKKKLSIVLQTRRGKVRFLRFAIWWRD